MSVTTKDNISISPRPLNCEFEKPVRTVFVVSERKFNELCQANSLNDDNVEQCLNTAFISIVDPHRIDKRHFRDNHSNVLNLAFSDMTDKETLGWTQNYIDQGIETKLFDEELATEIICFVNRNRYKVNQWLIHCHAGISRSGAIGLFIENLVNELDRESFEQFKLHNPQIHPNFYIVKVLNDTQESILQKAKEYFEKLQEQSQELVNGFDSIYDIGPDDLHKQFTI